MKRARIDKLGRIVIPMHYRKALGITTETDLTLDCDNNKIIISPSESNCKICEKPIIHKVTDLPICNECVEKIKKISRS
jgi:transcriptional pleiotropic regulator of transition state genes